jgi:hypothetical protein
MSRLEKLISISTDALAPLPEAMPRFLADWPLGPELYAMLTLRNGFYAFESALHVFPVTADPVSGLEAWNAESLWRHAYKDLADGLLFFAEDVFQDQFCLSRVRRSRFRAAKQGVMRFDAETGQTTFLADSIEAWADLILSDYSVQTGWQLAHDWQALHGPLPLGKRLMPKIPFILQGKYSLDNLYVGSPLEGMTFKGGVAMKIRDLPDGTKIRLRVVDWLNRQSLP